MTLKPSKSSPFSLDSLDLTATDRAALADFLASWLEHGRPVLFVGAGMSRHNAVPRPGAPHAAEIKDWNGLVEGLRRKLTGGDDSLRSRLPADYLRLAQLHETQFHRVRLIDAVEEALATEHFDPGPAHARLTRFQWEAIITTNYDDLIERAFNGQRHVTKVVWDPDLTRRRPVGTLLLIKMHGDLQDRDSIVLTEEDYRCYHQTRPGVALKVKQLLLEHPSLFVGFSMSDPNVAAIEGWIRDTTGQLKLPSIALVHSEPLIAERDMWARRGIKLVHLRSESLNRFFDALHGERERRERERHSPNTRETELESEGEREIDKLLERRQAGWETDAAKLLVRLTAHARSATFASAARYVFQGGWRQVSAESIQRVLEAFSAPERRAVLLNAQAHGILQIGGSGTVLLDIEDHLLNDPTLSASERASVLLNKAQRLLNEVKLADARETLLDLKALESDEPTRERVDRLLTEVLLRLGDDDAIKDQLLDAPLRQAAFAYARRGSVTLLTRGRLAAARWYDESLRYARDGDEKTAALFGIQACTEPEAWSRMHELDTQRLSILKEERPRTEGIHQLEDDAGARLLAMHRAGSKAKGYEVSQAVEKLREALAEADDMGWPRSVGPNLTTASDSLALDIVGLLMTDKSAEASIQQALTLTIERGLFGIARHFDTDALDRLAAGPEILFATRSILRPRAEAIYMQRTRSLLRSALLPLLTDDEIVEHVAASVDKKDFADAALFEKTPTETHLELLKQHYMVMPAGAATHLVRSFAGMLRNEHRGILRADWLHLPIKEWIKTGSAQQSDPDLHDLVSALTSLFDGELVRRDPFIRRMAIGWIDELTEAAALSPNERIVLKQALDSELEHSLGLLADRDTSALEFAAARAALGHWSPNDEMKAIFLGSYEKLKNSTALGAWMNAIGIFGQALNTTERARVATDIASYVEATLIEHHRTFGPFPEWAAEAVVKAAQSQIIGSQDALNKLRELGNKYPRVVCRAAQLTDVDLTEAEETMLRGRTKGKDDYSLLLWCQHLSKNQLSTRAERAAIGELQAPDGRTRQVAYWSAAALAKNGVLTDEGCSALADAILTFGARDNDWKVRGAAVASAARILDRLTPEQVDGLVYAGREDPTARVRRAAALLGQARSGVRGGDSPDPRDSDAERG